MISKKIRILPTKNNIIWTQHSLAKLKQYYLSQSRILRIIRHPERIESGIAPQTIAAMQSVKRKHPTEIWTMWQEIKIKNQPTIKIISAWRYPGISPISQPPPIPLEELDFLQNNPSCSD